MALLAGVGLIGFGVAAGEWLRALLPPVTADARAIGGAAAAVGSGLALIGLAQLAAALRLPGKGRRVVSAAALLAAIIAAALVAGAVAAVVASLSAAGVRPALYATAAASVAAAGLYAAAALRCIGLLASRAAA